MSFRAFTRSRIGQVFAGALLSLLLPVLAQAAMPQGVEKDLGALLDISQKRGSAINPQDYNDLLEYVMQMKGDARDVVPARRYDSNGSVLRVSMKTGLSRLMNYCYNPSIPTYLLFPSVLRLGGWYAGSDILKDSKPWTHLGKLDAPVGLWGQEYEVNAPDSFGGGYYRYDLNRLLILAKHNGKNVLISVSKQKDKSSVGKKAVILDEGEWSYFYSGINGLNKGLIGWADTYMYDSASVQVFVEDGPNQTTFTLFKWLRAGWSGLNVVQKDHINDGSTRYANAFKKIVESDRLPSPDELAARVRELSSMSDVDLDRKIAAYAVAIENMAKSSPDMKKSEFQKVVADGKYAKILNREERVGAILVEYLKSRLGKRPLVDFPATPVAATRNKAS
ncbi:MAG: hypothetical protein Q8O35_09705 [Humidesulfovibrio sp.]|uniref:hypothetical protein n=1 Tax=Humidesulfovibrio sp. TaxID=2910988 RepID=UPI002732713B|nr:hypothetical protein [Humidesulfovibrio sp.]MDP2848455.1 hypothetical protein [Humidesulfovibrio sp.]